MTSPVVWKSFETRVPGKWLLTGEHSVIRGVPSIAMPHPELSLSLRYMPSESAFEMSPASALIFIKEAFAQAKIQMPAQGKLSIESSIPEGAGLGSSAALCVALTRWISEPAAIQKEDLPAFATKLENYFHGQSSGVDVAVVSAAEPLQYIRGQGVKAIGLKSLPRFTFYDTNLRAKTSECVAQVEAYLKANLEAGQKSDERMREASRLALEGLKSYDSGHHEFGLQQIASAMNQANESFLEWKLVPESVIELQHKILREGALAVKLTGAGKGGMLVALWR